jgi:hypothetical protein
VRNLVEVRLLYKAAARALPADQVVATA